MMGRYSLGTTCHPFEPDMPDRASERAKALGFDHIDVTADVDLATLALPVGIVITAPEPLAGHTMCPAFYDGPGQWDACVAAFRAAPGCLLEPVGGDRVVNSIETARAMMAEVPGLRLCVDTAHVASWGGNPLEMLDYADHVQLRQGAPGIKSLHVDDPAGTVDFAAVIARLDRIGYRGALSIEYLDRPEYGLTCADPLGWTMDMARHVRALIGG